MAIHVNGMFKKQEVNKPERNTPVTSFKELVSNRPTEQTEQIDIKSIIKVKGDVKPPVKRETKAVSFTELMIQRELDLKAREQEALRLQIEEQQRQVAAERKQKQEAEGSGVIKPKYLEDKTVFYKNSGYIQDLLGEGN